VVLKNHGPDMCPNLFPVCQIIRLFFRVLYGANTTLGFNAGVQCQPTRGGPLLRFYMVRRLNTKTAWSERGLLEMWGWEGPTAQVTTKPVSASTVAA